ncbi:hypothetical protein [Oryza sativa Japonica Group]|uniref:Uncharacterized protein n=1 Tax=Oryza sativa subsp. japonica TaxID=39947 RepID=Q8S2G2_ORYSJ|nr:hypothetical protein OsJ_01813 [Oryza sativa Japonica Group]BAB86426.1 hypothetical protein [Oryza sativa Japonica Group]
MATVEHVDIQAVASVQLGMGKAATRLGTGTGTGMAAAPTWLGQVGMLSYVAADGVAGATVVPATPLSRAAFSTHAGIISVPSRAGAGDPSPPRKSTKWSQGQFCHTTVEIICKSANFVKMAK